MTATTFAAGHATVRIHVWADFNGLGWSKKDHLSTLVDWWVPRKGALVLVRDDEGNQMDGTVTKVWRTVRCEPHESLIEVKCDRDSWRDGPDPEAER